MSEAVLDTTIIQTTSGGKPARLLKAGDRLLTLSPANKLKEAAKLKNGQAQRADEMLVNIVLDLIKRVEKLEQT
jgi:hypothetical protein